MTTQKTYRPAMGAFEALQKMYAEKGAIDPELLAEFIKMPEASEETPATP